MSFGQFSRRRYLLAIPAIVLVIFGLGGLGYDLPKLNSSSKPSKWDGAGGFDREFNMTRIHAHAAGYTIFENLYYQNGSYVILTSAPWTIPETRLIVGNGWRHPDKDTRVRIKVYTLRDLPAGAVNDGQAQEAKLVGTSVTLQEAEQMVHNAVDLSSPMLICNDDNFVAHYYHWFGEMFLGVWRIWKHWEWNRGVQLPQFATLAFSGVYGWSELPEEYHKGNFPHGWTWEDPVGANKFFMEKLLDHPIIETRTTWEARDATNKLYRMPLVVLVDRQAGHTGFGSQGKPFGQVLRLPVPTNYLLELRNKLLKNYDGHVDIKPAHHRKPKVAYLTRQDTGRRLTDDHHTNLVAALQKLDDEGLADFEVIHFNRNVTLTDQVATMATIDFLVGVHGNGLTHSLWMTPGKGRTVFEIQAKACSMNDYSPLAAAAGLDHFLVRHDEMCNVHDCPPRGCHYPAEDEEAAKAGLNSNNLKVDPKLITDQIRAMIHKYHMGDD